MALELIPAILGAAAIFIAAYTLATPASRARVQARLDRLGHSQSLSEREEELTRPFFERVALPGIARAGSTARRLLPSTIATDLETRLTHASEPLSLHAFTLIQMASIGLGIVIITTGIVQDPHKLILTGVLAGAVGVAAMPLVWLGQAAASRRNRIHRELPDAADLIVTMVEAGMSIDAALARVAEEMDGPLADELRFTMRETTLGRSRKDALLGLVDHTDVPELRAFVQAIVHAQATGVPLGHVLRTQSTEIRLKKRQRAEEAAQKAPVKVLVVMIFFIMPALMMTLLVPAILRASKLI
jgi:tight adherence protein C